MACSTKTEPLYIVSFELDLVENYSSRTTARLKQHCRIQDEDKYLCIILYSHGGVFDTVPVPSLLEKGGTPPPGTVAPPSPGGGLTLYN